MALQVASTPPPHPVPGQVREKVHQKIDELLDAHAWDQYRSLGDTLVWEYGKESYGRVRLLVDGDVF